MKTHELKILTTYFQAKGKSFEIRKNDRDYKVGDVLILREIEPTHSGHSQPYTGNKKAVEVTYITDYAQKDNYVVMGIKQL